MDSRIPAIERLTNAVAAALGKTTDEIHKSECFEQAVYDMARSYSSELKEIDFSTKAQYRHLSHAPDRFSIVYRKSANTKELATFYHKYFPETQPSYITGMEISISFLIEPFIEKVLPTMKIWRTRPSCIQSDMLCYVDRTTMLISNPVDVGFGKALFISGADLLLGNWQTALRMDFNADKKTWEFKVPQGFKDSEFKFLTGNFDQGGMVNTDQLSWHEGENKVMIVHDHFEESKPRRLAPVGAIAKC